LRRHMRTMWDRRWCRDLVSRGRAERAWVRVRWIRWAWRTVRRRVGVPHWRWLDVWPHGWCWRS
ncbi:hypothetical protein IWW46_004280, partial [Coemansia sp. RSA 2440]